MSSPSKFSWGSLAKEMNLSLTEGSDAIAIFVHCAMLHAGFKPCDPSYNVLEGKRIADSWKSGDSCSFFYIHEQSALKFVVKSIPLGDKLIVLGTTQEDQKTVQVEITVADFVNNSRHASDSVSTWLDNTEKLHGIVSSELISKMLPMHPSEAGGGNTTSAGPSGVAGIPRRPQSGGGSSLLISQHNPRMGGGFGIGHDDLNPFAGMGYGGIPNIGGFGAGSGGGNFFGSNHPAFGGNRTGFPRPPGCPPGARFDPVGYTGPDPDNDFRLPHNPDRGLLGGPDPDHMRPGPLGSPQSPNPYMYI